MKRKEKKYNNKNDEAFEFFSTMHIQNHWPQQNSHNIVRWCGALSANGGAVWCVSEQLIALVTVDQSKKRNQIYKEEEYSRKDKKNDLEEENLFHNMFRTCMQHEPNWGNNC